jgi:Abortive infection alpha
MGLKHVGAPMAALATDFLSRVLAPGADATGVALAHPIEEWHRKRVDRANEIVVSAARILEEEGVDPQPVPGRILFPILQSGSLEENDALRSTWARLLASAAAADTQSRVSPAFAHVLAQLNPVDVSVIEHLIVDHLDANGKLRPFSFDAVSSRFGMDSMQAASMMGNFFRLGILMPELKFTMRPAGAEKQERDGAGQDGGPDKGNVTPFGMFFFVACSGKWKWNYGDR